MVAVSINIKNPETHRLARELAELTGESMTTAVTVAVRERRDRVLARRAPSRAQAMLELGRDTARRLPASVRDADHGELLYGDDGLPR
jgi:antitoxin VapB